MSRLTKTITKTTWKQNQTILEDGGGKKSISNW
jgi:hypothetical protein